MRDSRVILQTLSTEGRGVRLCWEYKKSRGPSGRCWRGRAWRLCTPCGRAYRKVDLWLPGTRHANAHGGSRHSHVEVMMRLIRVCWSSINNSLSWARLGSNSRRFGGSASIPVQRVALKHQSPFRSRAGRVRF